MPVLRGSTSGWMAAAYLDAVLNHNGLRVADISLIESPDVPRIGVGEATIPSITHVLSVIGLDEIEFLKRVRDLQAGHQVASRGGGIGLR